MKITRPHCLIVTLIYLVSVEASSFSDYFKQISEYFGYGQTSDLQAEDFYNRIPYEVSAVDEKFISEAAKLTGVVLSELDTCQQRVPNLRK